MFRPDTLTSEMDSLRKFALKLTKNPCDADDLLQSTIVRAMEKADLFEDDTNLLGWLSRIMYNLFVSDYRRKVKFESRYDPQTHIDNEYVDAPQDHRMECLQVQDALNTLSAPYRQILIMICVNGMRYDEVSGTLRIPVGTVRSRLFRARETLYDCLEMTRPQSG